LPGDGPLEPAGAQLFLSFLSFILFLFFPFYLTNTDTKHKQAADACVLSRAKVQILTLVQEYKC
jgi:hypothetical protein